MKTLLLVPVLLAALVVAGCRDREAAPPPADAAAASASPAAPPAGEPVAPEPAEAAPIAEPAESPGADTAPRPLLWKVSDADNSLYLLGSFHLLKPTDYPLARSTDDAFADAEQVVFELSPADLESAALAQSMAGAALRGDGRTLQQALPPQTWKRLKTYLDGRNMDPVAMQQYDAWFVSLLVALTEMQAAGLATDHGLDKHFAERTVAAGKPARGLETIDQQIMLFEGMSQEQQVQSLESTLEDIADIGAVIEEMHRLWRAGDETGLFAATGAEMRDEFPALYDRMNRDRNRAWIPELRKLLDDSGDDDALVIVGAMHLLGDDGVVEGLRAAGYTVERL